MAANNISTLQYKRDRQDQKLAAAATKRQNDGNGPKHPHDIRVKDPSQHPSQQEY